MGHGAEVNLNCAGFGSSHPCDRKKSCPEGSQMGPGDEAELPAAAVGHESVVDASAATVGRGDLVEEPRGLWRSVALKLERVYLEITLLD